MRNRYPIISCYNYLLQIHNPPSLSVTWSPALGPCTTFSFFKKLKMGICWFSLTIFPYPTYACRVLNVAKFFVRLQSNCPALHLNEGCSRGLQFWHELSVIFQWCCELLQKGQRGQNWEPFYWGNWKSSPFQNEITLANPTVFIINLRLHDLPPSDECPFSMLRTRAAFGICLAQTQIADPLFLVLCHFAFAF